ncbi:hypothetical protein LOK49_LG04G00115 [Camellia lanceoleosa]|uniref:Uncharacterized protein n=1 Tax=Camellia lanceoleosa TaxID=1840588 RepID=A0ACC0I1N0_9ERIC|nr:hypothetical protein LOK49_LG04G00115 [Camellia lanceoleosa]
MEPLLIASTFIMSSCAWRDAIASRITSFGKPPTPRAAHVATVVGAMVVIQVFVNARLHVSGGALGGGRMVEDLSSVAKSCKCSLHECCSPNSTKNMFGGNGDRAEEDIAEVKGALQNEVADHGDRANLQRDDMEINGFSGG